MKKQSLAGVIAQVLLATVIFLPWRVVSSQGDTASILVLNKDNQPITRLTDGDTIRLRVELRDHLRGDTGIAGARVDAQEAEKENRANRRPSGRIRT